MQNNKRIKIFRDTHFSSLSEGHGGNRRTLQIKEILSKYNYEIIDLQKKQELIQEFLKQSFFIKITQLIKIIPYFFNYFAFIFPEYKQFVFSAIKTWQLKKELETCSHDQTETQKILICEDSLNFLTPYLLKKQGFKIISLPHNFDSIALNNCDFSNLSSNFRLLKNEVAHFSCSDYIFCISREEQWFLRLFGLNSAYLPYYPPEVIIKKLLMIRKKRTCTHPSPSSPLKHFLILGTYLNTPTKHGIIELVNWLNSSADQINIQIAGFATEHLKGDVTLNSNCQLLGTVSEQELEDILVETTAVIINQRYGLGSLTKIPELLIAGVPILINSIAARSYHNHHGIHIFENKEELFKLLALKDFCTPKFLERPIQQEKHFINTLNQLII